MDLDAIECRLRIRFSERHRRALLDEADPIHAITDFLVPSSPHAGLNIVQVNDHLHQSSPDAWPSFLVAFASNGCGDYFAYDTRSSPASIIYIDPDLTVEENLASEDKVEYDSFCSWYAVRLERRANGSPPLR